MPQFRKLSEEEVRTLEYAGSGKRREVEEQYDALLSDFEVGDYGVVELAPGEKRLTVSARLHAAARRRGLVLTFLRTRGERLRFRVGEGDEAA